MRSPPDPVPLQAYLARYGFPIHYGYVKHNWPSSYYQTVYATEVGSAEMPSAGRAFTPELITQLVAHGVQMAPLILHTGVSSLDFYDTPYVTVVFLTPKGEKRVAEMVRWIENELTALGEGREADLFRVGEITDEPLQMWTGVRYQVPFIADHEQFYVSLPIPTS